IEEAFAEINAFERQLTDAGAVIVKFWLHISRKEQARRFRRLERHPSTSWRVSKEDWQQNKRYREWIRAADAMIEATNTANAPWTLVEATDDRYAAIKVLDTVCRALRERLAAVAAPPSALPRKKRPPAAPKAAAEAAVRTSILAGVDLSVACERREYDEQVEKYQERLREIEHELYRKRIAMLILYEGWDAAGKGGNIKRLTARLDPRGYEVVPIAAPNDIERAHHYLWRFWTHMPKGGHITIFDRTWYGRVLVERVEGFCSPAEWQRSFQEINEIERHIANFGTVIVKFWLHISPEEQLRRFRERERTPHKRWKITAEDYRNRAKWDLYREAVDEMLLKTSTSYAPWTIVESNCKWYARLKTLRTVIAAAEKAM
ncbi:MAG: phosphate--AMP phosphotransferase, partial [Planctomycetota bacterium]|nr:phosphate--AMP phosphotransferase [Planctomycetota bacterium]